MQTISSVLSENEPKKCPYCVAEQPDYNMDCYDCRYRLRTWSQRVDGIRAYVYSDPGSRILRVREEPEE